MKKLTSLFVILVLAAACYEKGPVYFNRPMGRIVHSFDESLRGIYFDLDDMTEDWLNELNDKIEARGDSVVMEALMERMGVDDEDPDTSAETSSDADRGRDILETPRDTLPVLLNEPISEILLGRIEFYRDNAKYTVYQFGESGLKIFTVDSVDSIQSYPLIQLSDTLRLTSYDDRYFLNFRSPLGWEIVEIKQLASDLVAFKVIRAPVWVDPPPEDLESLQDSLDEYYPNLNAIVNGEGHVIGFKARLRSRKVLKALEKTEESWLRLFKVI